jgi:hypothetical protein
MNSLDLSQGRRKITITLSRMETAERFHGSIDKLLEVSLAIA